MSFNLSSFLNKAKQTLQSVGSSIQENIEVYAPEKWSPEKQYINAIVASMALMVYADKKVENEEVELVINTINTSEIFKKHDMVGEGLELYSTHIEKLTTSLEKSQVEYTLTVAKIMNDISRVKKDEWKNQIVDLALNISASDGDIAEEEMTMLNKIKASLGV